MTDSHPTEEKRLGSEPAYPTPIAESVDGSIYNSIQQSSGENGGLTKRELFAAMAMQGICSDGPHGYEVTAQDAVGYADALLKELARG